MEQYLKLLSEYGVLGILLALSLWALWKREQRADKLVEELNAQVQKRTEDAQKVTSLLLDLNDKNNTSNQSVVDAVEALQYAIKALQEEIKHLQRK